MVTDGRLGQAYLLDILRPAMQLLASAGFATVEVLYINISLRHNSLISMNGIEHALMLANQP
jgi:hypothetical protein